MKSIKLSLTAAFLLASLFASCQNPNKPNETGDQNDKDDLPKVEYTVTFDNNCPSSFENGTLYSCSEYAPSSMKGEAGTFITLPSFSGELTKYVNNNKEGDYPFEKWNTASDGNGTSYIAGASFELTENITLYAIYSSEKKPDNTDDEPDGEYLNPSVTSSYSMKVGEKIQLYVENAESYTVTTGSDVVLINSDNKLEAIGAGNATVKVTIKDSIQTYSLVVTVTADTNNSNLDSSLIGKWIDGDSYLQFNSDGTGYLYYKSGSSVFLDTSCKWTTSVAGGKNWINISESNPSSSDGSYEYTVSDVTLRVNGRIAFGMASSSSWSKEY